MTAKTNPANVQPPEAALHRVVWISAAMIFFTMMSFTVSLPFYQDRYDQLGCDDLCRGGLTSMRSLLELIGSTLVGKLSDHPRIGRKPLLALGLVSCAMSYSISYLKSDLWGLWLSVVPSSLFNQNFSITNALLSDHRRLEEVYQKRLAESQGNTPSMQLDVADSAGKFGKIGFAVGVSFMVGPAIGATIAHRYVESLWLGMVFVLAASVLLVFVPNPPVQTQIAGGPKRSTSFVNTLTHLPQGSGAGVMLLMFMRLCMGLAYFVFQVVWAGTLKHKFGMTPKGQAAYMGWMGLCYALAQGFGVKPCIKFMKNDTKAVVMVCVVFLSTGRYWAYTTSHLAVVFLTGSTVVLALGVTNTIINDSCSRLADKNSVGGIYGVLKTMESGAGLVGPTLGGYLSQQNEMFPIYAVMALYSAVFVATAVLFDQSVVQAAKVRHLKLE